MTGPQLDRLEKEAFMTWRKKLAEYESITFQQFLNHFVMFRTRIPFQKTNPLFFLGSFFSSVLQT